LELFLQIHDRFAALTELLPHGRCYSLECGVGPNVPQASNRVGVEKQPEPLAGLDFGCQKRINDPNIIVAGAHPFEVSFLNESNVLAGCERDIRRRWRDGNMDGVATSVAILDQLPDLRSVVHLFHRSSN
jgi:hypothetical protein